MRIVIADDNKLEIQILKRILKNESDISIVGEASDGNNALQLILKFNPDAAFLDISMPGLTGIDVAQELKKRNVAVVFITAHHDYALDAFELGSVDYILKPITPERVTKTLGRLRRYKRAQYIEEKINLNIKGKIVPVNINKIIFIEKLPGIKQIKITTDEDSLIVNGTLAGFMEKLEHYGFARSHKSFIINTNKIEHLLPWGDKSYLAKMAGSSQEVLVSRKYASRVKELMS